MKRSVPTVNDSRLNRGSLMMRFLRVLFVFAAISCAHAPEYPPPKSPGYSTKAGRNCALKCQQIYYDCKLACKDSDNDDAVCESECSQDLSNCYELCKEILE